MTQAELLALEESHRAAQARLGLIASYVAARIWEEEGGGGPNWLADALLIIQAVRIMSRRLYKAYYRYARALETGYSLGNPESVEGDRIIMQVFVDEYREALEDVAELGYRVEADDPIQLEFEELVYDYLPQAEQEEGNFLDVDIEQYIDDWEDSIESDPQQFVEVDEFDWSEVDEMLDEMMDGLEEVLQRDVIDASEEKLKELESQKDSIIDFDAKLKERQDADRDLGAGRIDRYSINDGRRITPEMIPLDRRIKGVARGLGPNPCGFCAMLASRGFVYRSKVSATAAGGSSSIKRYHDNCHCYPIVRWIDASELPIANEWLQDQWYKVAAGREAGDARRTWRRWWDRTGRKQYWALIGEEPAIPSETVA